jgi:hypothetical protein
MSQFDDFVEGVLDGVQDIATDDLSGLVQNARGDARAFLVSAEEKLKRRTQMLADGLIDKEDFEDLVKGQADLVVLQALTQIGIGAARLERFRRDLIKLVVDTAFDVFL